MAQSHGYNNTAVGAKETTFGVAPASGFQWLGIVESFDPSESHNVDQRRGIGKRTPFGLRTGAKEVDASISVAVQNARLLAYALGAVSSAVDGGGYAHTITPIPKEQELPSLTIQNHNALHGLTRNYVGGKVDTLTLTAEVEEAVMMEAELQFVKVEDDSITPATVTAEVDNYFMFYEGAIKINTVDVGDITSFELEIANGLERRHGIKQGDGSPSRIEEGPLELTASLTMDFTNTDQWDLFKQGNAIEVELTLQDVADADHSIVVTLSGGLYDTNGIPASAEDLQEQELEAIFTGITVVAKDANTTLI